MTGWIIGLPLTREAIYLHMQIPTLSMPLDLQATASILFSGTHDTNGKADHYQIYRGYGKIDPLGILKAPNPRSNAAGFEYFNETGSQCLLEDPAKLHPI